MNYHVIEGGGASITGHCKKAKVVSQPKLTFNATILCNYVFLPQSVDHIL